MTGGSLKTITSTPDKVGNKTTNNHTNKKENNYDKDNVIKWKKFRSRKINH